MGIGRAHTNLFFMFVLSCFPFVSDVCFASCSMMLVSELESGFICSSCVISGVLCHLGSSLLEGSPLFVASSVGSFTNSRGAVQKTLFDLDKLEF